MFAAASSIRMQLSLELAELRYRKDWHYVVFNSCILIMNRNPVERSAPTFKHE